jgi:hypothetical protein
MKNSKIFYTILAISFFNLGCKTAYIKEKPVYVQMTRPTSPGYDYVWLDDNWTYSRKNQTYTRQNGYWSKPKANKNYKQGYWKTNKNGSHWVPGRWK